MTQRISITDISVPPVDTYERVTRDMLENEIRPAGRPALLKAVASDWPVVAAATASPHEAANYVMQFDNGRQVETIFGAPEIQGKFFYSDDLKGLNFHRRPVPLGAALSGLLSQMAVPQPGSIYIQSIPVRDHIPGFAGENRLSLLNPAIEPRIWIGNHLTVQTHFDLSENIACVAAGQRRFTLFPPDQLANMYAGPFEHTLAGPPISMVRIEDIDLGAYPGFEEALAHALVAELEPGDAIYIPYAWWHHVQSLTPFNILVNYWWNDAAHLGGSPFDSMLHAILAIRDLPPDQKKVWQTMFEHYVFKQNGEPVEHLPPEAQGALGPHTSEMNAGLWATLAQNIMRHAAQSKSKS